MAAVVVVVVVVVVCVCVYALAALTCTVHQSLGRLIVQHDRAVLGPNDAPACSANARSRPQRHRASSAERRASIEHRSLAARLSCSSEGRCVLASATYRRRTPESRGELPARANNAREVRLLGAKSPHVGLVVGRRLGALCGLRGRPLSGRPFASGPSAGSSSGEGVSLAGGHLSTSASAALVEPSSSTIGTMSTERTLSGSRGSASPR